MDEGKCVVVVVVWMKCVLLAEADEYDVRVVLKWDADATKPTKEDLAGCQEADRRDVLWRCEILS